MVIRISVMKDAIWNLMLSLSWMSPKGRTSARVICYGTDCQFADSKVYIVLGKLHQITETYEDVVREYP